MMRNCFMGILLMNSDERFNYWPDHWFDHWLNDGLDDGPGHGCFFEIQWFNLFSRFGYFLNCCVVSFWRRGLVRRYTVHRHFFNVYAGKTESLFRFSSSRPGKQRAAEN